MCIRDSNKGYSDDNIVVVSPDEGSIKRAIGHVKRLGGNLAIVDKRRASAMETTQQNLIGGPIEGKVALMFDDMISTAGSICGAAELVAAAGASEIHVAATHGVLCGLRLSAFKIRRSTVWCLPTPYHCQRTTILMKSKY